MLYDGKTIQQITEGPSYSNQGPHLNDGDEITWTRYDFCQPGWWISHIMHYSDGVTTNLTELVTNDPTEGQFSAINNQGMVAFQIHDIPPPYTDRIWLWNSKTNEITLLTGPFFDRLHPLLQDMNENGDVTFKTFDPVTDDQYQWIYLDGEFYDLGVLSSTVWAAGLNDFGEFGWTWSIAQGVWLMRRIRTGESDFDGDVDIDDFNVFSNCFTGPGPFDGLCECRFMDIDHDQDVDCDDWEAFKLAWTGKGDPPTFAPCDGPPPCLADLDGSGDVGVKDLLFLLGTWGPCPKKGDCPADFDDSGDVGVKDLLVLLGTWGPCP